MGSVGDSMSGTPIPAVGSAGTGYATKIVNFLTEVKTRLEARLPMSSLLIGVLDMANNAIQNIAYAGLYEQASTPTAPLGSLQRYNNDLYYVGPSGAVRITNDADLNATGIGGITGDYGDPNPAELRFVDADKIYYHYDDYGGGIWATTRQHKVQLAGGSTSTKKVTIDWAGGTDMTISLPAAVPGATTVMQMTTGGAISLSNVLNITSVDATGDITSADYHLTDTLFRTVNVGDYIYTNSGYSVTIGTHAVTGLLDASKVVIFGLDGLVAGDRVKYITLLGSWGTDQPTFNLTKLVAGTGTTETAVAGTTAYATPGGDKSAAFTITTPFAMTNGDQLQLMVTNTDAGSQINLYALVVAFDRP